MKKVFLIISDTHGRAGRIRKVLDTVGKADYAVFLGDGIRDFEATDFGGSMTAAVRGNCDAYCDYPDTLTLEIYGHKLLFCHGHTFGVKYGLDRLAAFCAQNGYDIALYGHTHRASEERINGVTLFNPGSLSLPSEGKASYGLLTVDENGSFLFSHGEYRSFFG